MGRKGVKAGCCQQTFEYSGVLPLHLKQTFPAISWIWTKYEGDRIKSRLPFKIFSTLNYKKNPYLLYRISTTMNGLYTSFCMFGLQWQKFAEVLLMVISTMTLILLENLTSNFLMLLQPCILIRFKPSLSMKILSINHFKYRTCAIVSRGLYFFYPIFNSAAAYITDNLCTKNGNSSFFKPKIRGL